MLTELHFGRTLAAPTGRRALGVWLAPAPAHRGSLAGPMEAPPSLGRRAAAGASNLAKPGDAALLPTAWGEPTARSSLWSWPWGSKSGARSKSSSTSKIHASKGFGRAMRKLMVRSSIGARKRARLLAAVAACALLLSALLLYVHHHAGSGSSPVGATDLRSPAAAATKTGARPISAEKPKQQLKQQQQPPSAKEQPKQQPKQQQLEQGDEPFPTAKRASITAEQLMADPDVTMPVRLPSKGGVTTGKGGAKDVLLSLCSLDIAPYHRSPAKFPKSRNLFGELCKDEETLSARALADDATAGRQLQPSGFVFHESRVGSTLVANILASVPTNLVYSEPHLPTNVVHECERAGCSEEETVELLRLAVLAMGRSHHHDELFIKFQSSMGAHMDLLLKAFPDTPWIFIYRDPVEVLVSNLEGGGGACLRHKKAAPEAVQAILGKGSAAKTALVGNEDFCAAHVAHLCDTALTHLRAEGSKGHAISYAGLVDELLDVVLPGHFGVTLSTAEHARMAATARVYSKAKTSADAEGAQFTGDAAEKQAAASAATKRAAETYLGERTRALEAATAARRGALAADAMLRATQEAYVYERTGSRAFAPPSCPDEPEYPAAYRVVDMVRNWNPDDMAVPARHYASLCRFDYSNEADRAKAARYLAAEVPFVAYNVSALEAAVAKWNTPGYLEEKLGDTQHHRVEVSKSNHFLYFSASKAARQEEPPTTTESWTYPRWRARAADRLAAVAEAAEKGAPGITPVDARRTQAHYYFRVSNDGVARDDMTLFHTDSPALFGRRDRERGPGRGIHCRFGMEGIVAEAHYDGHENWVAAVAGTRRWIMAAPKECQHAYLRPVGDPSARHSLVNWAAPDLEAYPEFENMTGTEVLLTPGDLLYVPSFWIHYIANLGYTAQCNSRTGRNARGLEDVQACGFHVGETKAQMK